METDFVPETFGRLTTLGPSFRVPRPKNTAHRDLYQEVRCVCGTIKRVYRSGLVCGKIKSCGCLQREKVTTHGHSKGYRCTPEMAAHHSMVNRCYNKGTESYPDYGGRGIGVWECWLGDGGFECWLAYIGLRPSKRHSLDRIDVEGHYIPGNIRWATPEEQQGNRRNNVILSFQGKSLTVASWSRETGISASAIHSRIKAGWSVDDTLTKPARKSNRKKAVPA